MKNIEYNVDKITGLTKEELDQLLSVWQKKLKMDDWDLSISIVNFNRKDFRQSGDFEADIKNKKAKILLTADPFRGDEEYTLVHELIHALFFELDLFSEESVIKLRGKDSKDYDLYMKKLESTVHKFTEIILGRTCSK